MPFTQVTLAQLQALMATQWDGSVFWTPEEARLALNEGLRLYNLLTGTWGRRVVIPTVADQRYYPTPAALTMRLRMTVGGQMMDPASLADMNNGQPNWRAETTASGGAVPTRPTFYIPVGMTTFAIWPADHAGGLSLSVDGLAATPVLVNPGDYLDLGQEEITALLGEALHITAFKLRDTLWRATAIKHRAFLAAAADKNDRLATSAYFREMLGRDREKDEKPIRGAATVGTPQQTLGGGQ